jgi:DNA segregation ATPase FtsK/SpoIIIE, S-DNA-T family
MKFLSFAQLPRVRELIGILCLVACLGAVLSLATFDPADPSWNTASPADPPHNAIGRVGACVADLGYQCCGLSIWLLPVVLLIAGWRSLKLRPVGPPLSRAAGYVLAVASVSGFLTLAGPHVYWHGSFEVGGTAGLLIATTLTRYLNPAGTLLLLGTFLLLALYLISTFTLHGHFPNLGPKLASYLPSIRRRPKPESASTDARAAAPPEESRRSRRGAEPEAQPESVPPGTPPGLESDLAAYCEDDGDGYYAPAAVAGEAPSPASAHETHWQSRPSDNADRKRRLNSSHRTSHK